MPVPDWSQVEWYVFGSSSASGGVVHQRPVPGKESSAVVKRCSLKTVLHFLKQGVPPQQIQGRVDACAEAQAARCAKRPNAYVEFCEMMERKARERVAEVG